MGVRALIPQKHLNERTSAKLRSVGRSKRLFQLPLNRSSVRMSPPRLLPTFGQEIGHFCRQLKKAGERGVLCPLAPFLSFISLPRNHSAWKKLSLCSESRSMPEAEGRVGVFMPGPCLPGASLPENNLPFDPTRPYCPISCLQAPAVGLAESLSPFYNYFTHDHPRRF
jgi:hypothetical protein